MKYLLYCESPGKGKIYVNEDVLRFLNSPRNSNLEAEAGAALARLPEREFKFDRHKFNPLDDGIAEVKTKNVRIYGWQYQVKGVRCFMAAVILKKSEQEVPRDWKRTNNFRSRLATGVDYVDPSEETIREPKA